MHWSSIISVPAIGQWGIDHGIYALMNTRWGWPIAESAHFIGICFLMGCVGLFDMRMIGLVRGPSLVSLHPLIPFGVVGYVLSACSGMLFVIAAPAEYIDNPAWQIKMGLMALAGLNMILFYWTTARAVRGLSADQAAPLAARLFALVSLSCWLGVITCGRVITAFRPYFE